MVGMEVDDQPTKAGSKQDSRTAGTVGRFGQQVCRYWLQGRCLKGDDCEWLHPDDAGTTGPPHSSNGPAKGRLGAVNDNDGGFSNGGSGFPSGGGTRRHVQPARWGRPRGSNNKGGADVARRRQDKVCNFWLKGTCERGDDCNYLHAYTTIRDISLIKQLAGHDKAVRAIALPDGSAQLYTGGQDEIVRVWDCNTGECTNVMQMGGDVGALLSAAIWLFIGLPNEVKIWDLQANSMRSLNFAVHGQVHALTVYKDMLFAGTHSGSVLIWKYSTSSNIFEAAMSLNGHSGSVFTLCVNGNQLLSGSVDKSIKVWDLETGQCVQTLEGHTNVVMQIVLWEKHLLSCSLDGTVKVWAPTPEGFYEARYSHPQESKGQANTRGGAITMIATQDSFGKSVLLCAYNDDTLKIYELPSFAERGTIQTREEVRAIQGGPGGLFFSGEGCGEIKVWRFGTEGTGLGG